MSIAVVTMVRNEAERYLCSALSAWHQFADEIIALDDASDDSTAALLRSAGARVDSTRTVQVANAWGAEWLPRKMLWEMALESRCDWLFWLDADMIPAGDPRELEARDVDAIAFRLFDLWAEDGQRLMYRADGHWQGHHNPRIWMIRNPRHNNDWQWLQRGLHCGHLPANYAPRRTLVAPVEYSLLHYGYLDRVDRAAKQAAYCGNAQHLSANEYAHAASIEDDTFIAFPLPFEPLWRLERASPSVRQSDVSSTSLTPTTTAFDLF